jgi:D-xylose 1-dehydrogenase (NADP+, D-xylono-1,5-lactone-forming)
MSRRATFGAPEGLGGGAVLDLGCYCISAIRLFGGQPLRVSAAQVVDTAEGADGSDLRLAATFALPGDALAQFDVALDFPRRDELELIGTNGKITIPDPWLCRHGTSSWNATAYSSECRPTHPDGSDCPRISTTMMPIGSSSRTPHG